MQLPYQCSQYLHSSLPQHQCLPPHLAQSFLMICIILTTQITAISGAEDCLKHISKNPVERAEPITTGAGHQPAVNATVLKFILCLIQIRQQLELQLSYFHHIELT